MNVVIFGKGFGKTRQINLSGKSATAFALLIVGTLSCAAFAGGYWFSAHTGSGVSFGEMANLSDELIVQKSAIETTRQETEDTLDALAIRIGQMNARVIRLDALGRRLTDMADLSDGEFDFDSAPAIGGPEEPYATGSNIAVPEVLAAMTEFASQLNNREAQLSVLESVLMNQNLSDRVLPTGSTGQIRLDVVLLRQANRPVHWQAGQSPRCGFCGQVWRRDPHGGRRCSDLVVTSLRFRQAGRDQSRQWLFNPLCT